MSDARRKSTVRTTELAKRLEDRQVVQFQHFTPHADVPLGLHVALKEALGVDEDEIAPEATLTFDLGFESIYYLDINFRLEGCYGIEIPRFHWYPDDILARNLYVNERDQLGGATILTEAGVVALMERLSHLGLTQDHFGDDRHVPNFVDLMSVGAIRRYLEKQHGDKFWAFEQRHNSPFFVKHRPK